LAGSESVLAWVCLMALTALPAHAQVAATYGWRGEASSNVYLGDDAISNAVQSGKLQGLLHDTNVRAIGQATGFAEAQAAGKGYTLKLRVDAAAQGSIVKNDVTSFAGSTIRTSTFWTDTARLEGQGQIPAGSLLFNWKLDGEFHSALDQSQRLSSTTMILKVVDSRTSQNLGTFEYRQEWNSWTQVTETFGARNVQAGLQFTLPLGSTGQPAQFGVTMSGECVTSGGTCSIEFGKTLRLESITFPDGSTPESHGFAIVFDSGLISPNRTLGQAVADFSRDGMIDADDHLAWQAQFGTVDGEAFAEGDADGDRDADGGDFLAWQQQFIDYAANDDVSSARANIPEPRSIVSMAWAATLAGLRPSRTRPRRRGRFTAPIALA
jgi:hypothetical protein